jgi:hypothetical protein
LQNYPTQYIREKLAIAQGLVAAGSPLVSQNPAGWLRKAIEEDYAPPRNPKRSRRRQARKVQDTVIAIHSTQTVATEKVERAQNELTEPVQNVATQPAQWQQNVSTKWKQNGGTHNRDNNTENIEVEKTDRENQSVWQQTIEKVREGLPPGEAGTQLRGTALLQLTDTTAKILVANPHAVAWLERRLYGQIAKAMKGVLGKDLDLQFVAVS